MKEDVQPGDSKFIFTNGDVELFRICADGTVIRGPGFTTVDEMSLAFWNAVEEYRRPLLPLQK